MKLLLYGVMAAACCILLLSGLLPCHEWVHFGLYLAAVLLASGMKIKMPGGESTVSINFPFILLAIIETSLPQALLIAGLSTLAQCLDRRHHHFTAKQIAFNVANAVNATASSWYVYHLVLHLGGQRAPAVAAATLIYAAVNMVTVARMVSWATGKGLVEIGRKGLLDYVPYYLIAAGMATAVAALSKRYGWLTAQLIFPFAWACYRGVKVYVDRFEDRKRHMEELTGLHLRTIEALAMAIEAKDQNTHEHLCRVRVYVSEIGLELKLNEEEMQALVAAALLHDIGKLAVPEHIINKPGKLTPEEFDKMKIHPVVGAEILERVGFPYPVVPVVRSHHESWDGKGYPDGLKGEEIPIASRILSAVDCFDALASDRPYRRALPLDEVIEHLKKLSGTKFDPAVVEVLARRYHELEPKAREESARIVPFKMKPVVVRGEAPGAGFEQDGRGLNGEMDEAQRDARLASIAAACQVVERHYELVVKLGATLSLEEMLSMLCNKFGSLIPFDCFAIYLKEGDAVVPVHVSGQGHQLFSSLSIPLGEGLSGWVAQNCKPIINGNPSVEPGYQAGEAGTVRTSHLRSALAIPLETFDGEVLGVLALYCVEPEAFTSGHLRLLQAVGSKVALSIEASSAFKRAGGRALVLAGSGKGASSALVLSTDSRQVHDTATVA